MKRSKFPQNVEVQQRDLARTEDSKSEEIRQRQADSARIITGATTEKFLGGVIRGLRVTRNSITQTNIDVTAGAAYMPNGERAEISSALASQPLSDYTDGNKNYVCVWYTETESLPAPHELTGTALNTAVSPNAQVVVLSKIEYDALPETNSDITQKAKDRLAIVAVVLGNGTGIALNINEITQESIPAEHLGVRYASTAAGAVITGINVVSLTTLADLATTTPQASLRLVVASETSKLLSFRETGGTYGASVAVSALSGTTTVTSTNGSSVVVDIDHRLLPHTAATYETNLTVTRTYQPDGPMFSPADMVHRAKIGAGCVNDANPHAIGLVDMAQSFLSFARTLGLGANITTSNADLMTPRLVMEANHGGLSGSRAYTLLWEIDAPTGGDSIGKIRAYFTPYDTGLEFTVNARYIDAFTTYYVPDIDVTMNPGATSARFKIVSSDSGTGNFFAQSFSILPATSTIAYSLFDDLSIWKSGNNGAFLELGRNRSQGSGEALVPRLLTDARTASSPSKVHVFKSGAQDGIGNYDANTYHTYLNQQVSGSSARRSVEVVVGAEWNGTLWSRHVAATTVWKAEFANDIIKLMYKLPTDASSWTDSSWRQGLNIDLTTTGAPVVTAHGTVGAGYSLTDYNNYHNNLPRFKSYIQSYGTGTDATVNGHYWLIDQTFDNSTGVSFRKYAYIDQSVLEMRWTINAYWDGFNWHWDADSSSTMMALSDQGIAYFRRPNSGGGGTVTWADVSWGPGNSNYFMVSSGSPSPTATNSPDWPTSRNRSANNSEVFSRHALAKAWGYVTLSSGVPTLQDGYNVFSVTGGGSGSSVITVNLANSMANSNYAVEVVPHDLGASASYTVDRIPYVNVSAKTTLSFALESRKHYAFSVGTVSNAIINWDQQFASSFSFAIYSRRS